MEYGGDLQRQRWLTKHSAGLSFHSLSWVEEINLMLDVDAVISFDISEYILFIY